jgi:hypothetical protein
MFRAAAAWNTRWNESMSFAMLGVGRLLDGSLEMSPGWKLACCSSFCSQTDGRSVPPTIDHL